jgi:GxxExxY protein
LIEEATSGEIIGAFYHVYNILGFGLLESTYARALEISLMKRGLRVEREVPIEVFFEGERVGFHRADMLVERRVIVEIKSCHTVADAHQRQLLNYVTAMNLDLGMLLHFGPSEILSRPRSTEARPVTEQFEQSG